MGSVIQRIVVSSISILGAALWIADAAASSDPDPASTRRPGETVAGTAGGPPLRFGRDIRPILSDRCFLCHGPDAATQMADLRLDSFEAATRVVDGLAAIVPGNPEASLLFERITAVDPHDVMPPPDSGKIAISESEAELIRRWIEEGAEYEDHWAFEPLQAPVVPLAIDDDWSRNDIDRFTMRRLRESGLEPAAEADRATLARRVHFDLTGLPPTPAELDDFLTDTSDDAYERLVDRLLTEEPYRTRLAERMATPWLDLARFADTSGIHMDAGRQIWPYRDWVLNAFRENMPFDQFTIEQLAGDLLPNPTLEQLVASGFHRNHVTSDEGGAIADEYLLEYAVDRVETTAAVWLGLTVGCARCHDHKYDPISQQDFYSLIAFFNNVEQPGIYTQVPDSNRAFEPFLEIPRAEDAVQAEELMARISELEIDRDQSTPEEQDAIKGYLAELMVDDGFAWSAPEPQTAESVHGASMSILEDGSVLASGENPAADEFVITYRIEAGLHDAFLIEALPHESLPGNKTGRSPNGNSILSGISAEAVSVVDPTQRVPVPLEWAWADHEQPNGDFKITNALRPDDGRVWAAQSYDIPGARTFVFLAAEPFGFDGGTDLVVRYGFKSPFAQHVIGRTRLHLGRSTPALRAALPVANTNWYIAGPYPTANGAEAYGTAFGPEEDGPISFGKKYRDQTWRYSPGVIDGQTVRLGAGIGAEYVAREIYSPDERTLSLSLGSDDGIQVHRNGEMVFERQVARGVAPDQDQIDVPLVKGRNTLVLKIINTGGAGGMYYRADPPESELSGPAVAVLVPETTVRPPVLTAAGEAIRMRRSPRYRTISDEIAKIDAERRGLLDNVPKTMVMKERAMVRDTYIMMRGQYDQPDVERPVSRAIPTVLGSLPDDLEQPSRLDLARWIVSDENPLTARVVVNRYWAMLFGRGLVESVDDFGLQGDWPSHPDLLDQLAVNFREGGWDQLALLRRMVTSATYRQSARRDPRAFAIDFENELLSSFPRQRLAAEQIRDQALFASGLLVERLGGPSVKPYQPEGLWREVAMLQSNTRNFQQGYGDDLYRRSVYTYWKRASPPPSMLALDAPTREYCSTRRITTNTPLQALVLWNDPQFVEAARMLAARVITDADEDDARFNLLFRHATASPPSDTLLPLLRQTLSHYRERYGADSESAVALIAVGETMAPAEIDPSELAAWTMLANAVLCSDAAIVKD
ncbi:MAG: PSD1 and planctomycete cytochrome C domain-containing protein [Phycisphaerales bacterium]|nr:PSD1 and planctomycete cytochrome C domain-containing protein [Phycisphaerales bacterium]